jgi:nitrilase
MPADEQARLPLAEAFGNGPLQAQMASLARQYGIWLLAGTLPLQSGDATHFHNSSLLFSPTDNAWRAMTRCICSASGMAMNITPKQTPCRPGTSPSAPTRLGQPAAVGATTCAPNCIASTAPGLISAPAAFTRNTGRAHWDLLLRTRAVENLAFVIAPAQCGRHPGGKETYGHSMIVDPWGRVLACHAEGEGMALARLDLTEQDAWRARLPALQHRRL